MLVFPQISTYWFPVVVLGTESTFWIFIYWCFGAITLTRIIIINGTNSNHLLQMHLDQFYLWGYISFLFHTASCLFYDYFLVVDDINALG